MLTNLEFRIANLGKIKGFREKIEVRDSGIEKKKSEFRRPNNHQLTTIN